MSYISIKKIAEGKVIARANIDGEEHQAEFYDMLLAVIWAEELLEGEGDPSTNAQDDGESKDGKGL